MAAPSSPFDGVEPAWPDDAVEVGRIGEAWGVKGWFRVTPYATDPQALFSSRRWFLKLPEAQSPLGKRPAASSAVPAWLRIATCREHGDGIVAQAHDVADRGAAEALRGARIFISRDSFPTPEPDEFYWVDLIGLAVVNREGEQLGHVAGLIDTGPHSVLRVQPEVAEAPERLIPFVGAYVVDVSLAQRVVTVDWGLDY